VVTKHAISTNNPLKVIHSKTLLNNWTPAELYLKCPRGEGVLTNPVIPTMQTSITSKAKYHDGWSDWDEGSMDLLSEYNGLPSKRREWAEGINTTWIRFEVTQDRVQFRVGEGGGRKIIWVGWKQFWAAGKLRGRKLSRVCVTPRGSLICSAFVYFSGLKPLWRHIEVPSSSITWHRESCRERQLERDRKLEIVLGGEGRVVYCSQLHLNQLARVTVLTPAYGMLALNYVCSFKPP
jgi:hypothetical protein